MWDIENSARTRWKITKTAWRDTWVHSYSSRLASFTALLDFVLLYLTRLVTNMDLALPKMRWTMDPQGPTGHMAACDQEDIPRTGVMAHRKMASLLPFLHRSAVRFSSFFNQITKKTSAGPCRDSPSLLPGNPPQGDDSWGSDGLGAAHQEHWPMAIHSHL